MGTRLRVAGCHCRSWDHPHAYGDKQMLYTGCYTVAGSSPRVWGQVTIHLNSFGCRGIIPTRMGTSKSSAQCFPCLWDHPHAYGDKRISLDSFIVRAGSSPRVWGQVSSALNKIERKWIIPTRMGTSREAVMNGRQYEDHPHAYGDKAHQAKTIPMGAGSSPRVWGQARVRCRRTIPRRIIPTRMGTRILPVCVFYVRRDHPHAYGDKQKTLTAFLRCHGSSPRVWGQDSMTIFLQCMDRIIPTRMGTSSVFSIARISVRDHPHAYGDKILTYFMRRTFSGSSPRVWGQVPQLSKLTPSLGIIPTRMGTRIRLKRQDLPTQDHPHAYGDKFIGSRRRSAYNGSSPRVWGQVLFSCVILIL